jgi:hypothetical protein
MIFCGDIESEERKSKIFRLDVGCKGKGNERNENNAKMLRK